MTLEELRTLFTSEFPAGSVSDAEFLVWANSGALDMIRKTICLKTTATATITASQQEYTFATSFSITDFLMVDPDGGVCRKDGTTGYWYRLESISLDWLDKNVPNWKNADEGSPTGYYYRTGLIGLYPIPSATVANGLKMYYIQKPNVLANDGDEAFSADQSLEPYHPLIVTYALWKAKQKRGQFTQANAYQKEYYDGIAMMLRETHFDPDYQQVIRPYYKGRVSHSSFADPLGSL